MSASPYSTVAEAAAYYVGELGFSVGTVHERNRKHPVGGFKSTTTDAAVLADALRQHPGRGIFANLAASNIVEIDVDVRGDGDGHDTLTVLEADLGPLPPTWTARTPSGGSKRIFRRPEDTASLRQDIAQHVELRANGGMNLPPSIHTSGERYAWAAGLAPWDVPLAELPGSWIDFARRSISANRSKFVLGDEPIVEGTRRRELLRLAGAQVRSGVVGDTLAAVLHTVNAERCEPPLADSEVDGILRSATAWEPGAPPAVLMLGARNGNGVPSASAYRERDAGTSKLIAYDVARMAREEKADGTYMNTIMVDYDLVAPGQKYEAISKYIKAHSAWAKPLKSTWLIRTSKPVTQVRDDVRRLIDSTDKLLVTDVTSADMAWYGLPEDVSKWIKDTYNVPAY